MRPVSYNHGSIKEAEWSNQKTNESIVIGMFLFIFRVKWRLWKRKKPRKRGKETKSIFSLVLFPICFLRFKILI